MARRAAPGGPKAGTTKQGKGTNWLLRGKMPAWHFGPVPPHLGAIGCTAPVLGLPPMATVCERSDTMTVEEHVRAIILTILDVKEKDIVPSASLRDDLRATSLDLVDILTAFQNTFDVEIDDQQAAKLNTVQDAVDFLTSSLQQP
jgi:acyl carrier protein